MRKLSAGNKSLFSIFAVVILLSIAIIIISVIVVNGYDREEYSVASGTYAYDEEYNQIKTKEQGTIKKNWFDIYYLTENDGKKERFNLGKTAVTYSSREDKVTIYGVSYEILKDATVEKNETTQEIADLKKSRFFKLDDRRYLITGETIENANKSLSTEKYLLVILDKAGNTTILNNEVSAKTINALTLKTPDYTFDVAKEKLIYKDLSEIDLKKIIGSTNEYREFVKPENTLEENKTEENENGDIQIGQNGTTIINRSETTIQNNDQTTTINNQQINQNINNNGQYYNYPPNQGQSQNVNPQNQGQNANTQNQGQNQNTNTQNGGQSQNTNTQNGGQNQNTNTQNGGQNQNTNTQNGGQNTINPQDTINPQNGQTTNENSGNASTGTPITEITEEKKNEQPLLKNVSLRNVEVRCSYIDVFYSVIDPQNRYQTIYLSVVGDTEQTIALDKNKTSYRILGLTPNSTYTVVLSDREILSDGTIQENIEDTMNIRTDKVENTIEITRIARNRIYFDLKLDKNYVPDSCKVALYINGEKEEEQEVKIEEATSEQGWTSNFYYNYGTNIEIRLEDFIYNGEKKNVEAGAKFINY